jgi:PEP-CTERM motif
MSKRLLIATTAAMLTTVSASYATTTTITGTYSASVTETSGKQNFAPAVTTLGLGSPFSLNLTVGAATTEQNFISVNPQAGNKGTGTITGNTTVNFTFLAPSNSAVTGVTYTGNTATLSAGVITVSANYELFYGTTPQSDCITWNATTCTDTGITTTIGDTLGVTFADGAVLNVNLYNWSDWNMTPGISFQLVKGPTPAPEPASIALSGAGLAGLGVIRRRRKGVKNSDTP